MYDCSCDGDPPSFYSAKLIKAARKAHKCKECRGRILPGDAYERAFMIYDGDVHLYETCSHCYDLRTWLMNNLPCLCIVHGNQDYENYNAIEGAYARARDEVVGVRFGYLRRKIIRDRHNRARASQ